MTRLATIAGFVLLLARPAAAAPYWISYEANDYPENEGWHRNFGDENGQGQGGSDRSLDNGVLTLDSTRNDLIHDSYRMSRQLNPDVGELFVAEWRLRMVDASGPLREVGVTIARDGRGTLGFRYGIDSMNSPLEGWTYPIIPDQFHAFRLTSFDMVDYSLWMDGVPIRNGSWDLDSLNESYFAFGDSGSGGTVLSYSQWDYVRFGVIPEPGSGWILAIGWFLCIRRYLR